MRLGPGKLDVGNAVVRSRGAIEVEWSGLRERWEAYGSYGMRQACKAAGWWWDPAKRCWWTRSEQQAAALKKVLGGR